MFENPIQGSVGGACKRIAGVIYGILSLCALFVFLINCVPIFNQDLLNTFTSANAATFPTIISVMMQRLILDGKQEIAKIMYYLVVFGNAVWQGLKLWLIGYGSAFVLNILAEWTNSIAIIAHRMPKGSSKE